MNWRNVFHWLTIISAGLSAADVALPALAAAVPALLPVAATVALLSTVSHAIVKKASEEGLTVTDNTYHQ